MFRQDPASRFRAKLQTPLLRNIAAQPEARLSALEMLTEAEKQAQAAEQKERAEANVRKLRSIRRKAFDPSMVMPAAETNATNSVTSGD